MNKTVRLSLPPPLPQEHQRNTDEHQWSPTPTPTPTPPTASARAGRFLGLIGGFGLHRAPGRRNTTVHQ
jgi:hypothetical protein